MDERKAMQKLIMIYRSFSPTDSDGTKLCETDKDMVIKYLLQRVASLEERIHKLESRGPTWTNPGDDWNT